ncbi:MAG: winged helix-turn-helix domain-containing protein [Nitrososphaera sp.]|nr:winged helix-turn-helix domain-containing protein [Nitrososphaera sp.]
MTTSSYVSRESGTDTALSALKILSNKNRFLIMKTLISSKRDVCVHELSETIGISQSATSHQLVHLEARGVVESVRMGKTKCYLPTDTPLSRKLSRVIQSLK